MKPQKPILQPPAVPRPKISNVVEMPRRIKTIGSFNIDRALSIAHKEVRHIVRDPFTLGLALGLPLLMVLFFGYAMDFDVHDINIAVYDQDHPRASRQLTEVFQSSGYFHTRYQDMESNPAASLDAEQAKGALFIEPHFA